MAVGASQFFAAWFEAVHEMKGELSAKWRNRTEFTKLVKIGEECVLQRIAAKLGLKCYPYDYYSTDAILYQDADLVPGLSVSQYWFRHLTVAFEHENDFRRIYQEAAHLLILNADLRVLVTYPDGEIDDPVFAEVATLIRGTPHEKELSEKKSFLLILGGEADFEWQGFYYEDGRWAALDMPGTGK